MWPFLGSTRDVDLLLFVLVAQVSRAEEAILCEGLRSTDMLHLEKVPDNNLLKLRFQIVQRVGFDG